MSTVDATESKAIYLELPSDKDAVTKRSNHLNNANKARKGNGNFQFHCINW